MALNFNMFEIVLILVETGEVVETFDRKHFKTVLK